MLFSLKTTTQEIIEYTDVNQLIKQIVKKARENDKLKSESLTFKRVYTVYNLGDDGMALPGGPKTETVDFQGRGKSGITLPLDMNRILEDSYNFEFAANKIQFLYEEPVYVIHFWPKAILPDNDDGYYKAANRSMGVIYVSKEHLYVRHLEAIMDKPFNVLVGLGRIRRGKLTLEQKILPELNNIVVIDHFTAIVRYRRLFSERHENYTYTYGDYKLIE